MPESLHFLREDIEPSVASQISGSIKDAKDSPKFPFELWFNMRRETPELAKFIATVAKGFDENKYDPRLVQYLSRAMIGVVAVLEGTAFARELTDEFGDEMYSVDTDRIIDTFGHEISD